MSRLSPQIRVPMLYPQSGRSHVIPVYPAQALLVVDGVNEGEILGPTDHQILDDIYRVSPQAEPSQLAICFSDDDVLTVHGLSETGRPGAKLHLDAVLTFFSDCGRASEVLILAEQDAAGQPDRLHLLPLSPLSPKTDYTLVGIERQVPSKKLALIAHAFCARGTRIATCDGHQKPVEHLSVGERVLTRDHGLQPIKGIDHATVRATGRYAPIRITQNVLRASADLVISREQRVDADRINQTTDGPLSEGAKGCMVKASQLVDGVNVTVEEGGFVDYFHLVFDTPQIIFAEGVAIEATVFDESAHAPDPVASSLTRAAAPVGVR